MAVKVNYKTDAFTLIKKPGMVCKVLKQVRNTYQQWYQGEGQGAGQCPKGPGPIWNFFVGSKYSEYPYKSLLIHHHSLFDSNILSRLVQSTENKYLSKSKSNKENFYFK